VGTFRAFMFITAIAFASVSFATEETAKHDEMMKMMMETGTPGPEHKTLAAAEGDWNLTGKNWEKPNTKPSTWSGTSSMQMILGGRFLQQSVKGEMMGMAYQGTGTTGFNNIEKRFESTWMDNMSTSAMTSQGQWDAKTKTITERGQHSCPFTPNKVCTTRSELKMVSKDKLVFNLYGPDETGKEYRMMELTYTRTK
jgi:hypothetical protein